MKSSLRLRTPFYIIFLFTSLLISSAALSQKDFKVGLTAELYGSFALDKESSASDSFFARGAELEFYGPLDHLFDAALSLAAHSEGSESTFEVHEAYLSSSRLVNGFTFKLGRYFLGIGRLNKTHRHVWPILSAPKVQEEFFSGEGIIDSGFEVSYLLPLPFYLDLTVGVADGTHFGAAHGHQEGHHLAGEDDQDEDSHGGSEKPLKPTTYAHLATFFSAFGMDFRPALNYLQHQSSEHLLTRLSGVELVAKKKTGNYISFLLQSEYWWKNTEPEEGEKEESEGGYGVIQYGFSPSVRVGAEFDAFKEESLKYAAFGPSFSYLASEYTRFRLTAKQMENKVTGGEKATSKVIELGVDFTLGAHKTHEF